MSRRRRKLCSDGWGVFVPNKLDDVIAWYKSTDNTGPEIDSINLFDIDINLVNSNCGTFDGADDYLEALHLTGSETVVSSGGTATPTVSAGRIDFTAGTCWDLRFSDGTVYPISEGKKAVIADISGAGNYATVINASTGTAGAGFWANTQDDYHKNITDGFTIGHNLLAASEDLAFPNWTMERASVVTDDYTTPSGLIMDKIQDDTNAGFHGVSQAVTIAAGDVVSFRVLARADEYSAVVLFLENGGDNVRSVFDLSAGTVGGFFTSGNGAGENKSITLTEDGVYDCRISGIVNNSSTSITLRVRMNNGVSASYTGDGVSGVHVTRMQSQVGEFTDYQRTYTDSNEGSYLPAGSGIDITNPAGDWHNNAETQYNFPSLPELEAVDAQLGTRFFYESLGGASKDISYADIVANYENANLIFARINASDKRDLTIVSTPLTGSELAKANDFFNIDAAVSDFNDDFNEDFGP